MEEVQKLLEGSDMERCIGEEEDFVGDAKFDRKPVRIGVMCCHDLA